MPVRPSAIGQGGLTLCADVPVLVAPASRYRTTPIYVGNEMPTDAVRAWAETRPGFAEVWIDREHQGWISVGFTADAEARQAELEAAFPGVGVVAVSVQHSTAELEALAQRVAAETKTLGIEWMTASTHRGVVEVGIGVLEPGRVAALAAAFPGEPICVDGIDPADAVPPGPQASGGDGWRLLAHVAGEGPAYRTGIAWDSASYAALWKAAGLQDAPVPVDFETEVAIWFGAVTGSSCPGLRLDGVVVDPERSLVHADLVLVGATSCTADIFPQTYVVALRRDRLPRRPFAIQLNAEDPPAGVPEERTVVDVDLSHPGAVAGPGDVHGDPALFDPPPRAAVPGDTVETGFETLFRFPVTCGAAWIGPLNDTWWRTGDPAVADGTLPAEWQARIAPDGTLIATILVETDPARLRVTTGGRLIDYRAVTGAPDCR